MIKYYIEITRPAEKELLTYPAKLQNRIINKINLLADNPRPFGFKKLFGVNLYRIRTGDYRIIYTIDDTRRSIRILDLGHRKDIYR